MHNRGGTNYVLGYSVKIKIHSDFPPLFHLHFITKEKREKNRPHILDSCSSILSFARHMVCSIVWMVFYFLVLSFQFQLFHKIQEPRATKNKYEI
jgi:hypothetical protein